MPDLAERMAKLEAHARFKSMSPQEQAAARNGLREKISEEYREIARTKGEQQRTSMEGAIGPAATGALHSGFAGLASAADTATLGYLPKMVSAVPGTRSEEEIRASLDVAKEQQPIASMAGGIAGNFVGPASLVAKAGAAPAKLIPGLAETFGSRMALATLKNMVGGAGAIAATELTRSRADDADLGQRLGDAMAMATTPTNLALSVGGGALQAKLSRPPAAALATAVQRYERVTGKRVPIETLTDSAAQKKFYDMLARTPGMEDTIAKQRSEIVAGLKRVTEDIRSRALASGGGTAGTRARAASAARRVVGDDISVLAKQRQSMTGAALNQTGRRTLIPDDLWSSLEKGMGYLRRTRPKNAESPELDQAFDRLADLRGKGATLTVDEYEELRKVVGGIGHSKVLGAKDVGDRAKYEARRYYDVLQAGAKRHFPEYSNALSAGKQLRSMEQALGDVNVSQVDDAMMESFFASKNVPKNWDTLVRNSTPEDTAAAKGWLFYKLMSRVSNADGYINPETLRKVTSSSGRFNSQVLDKILPGVRRDLEDHAKLSAAIFGKGAGRFGPEGSQTAGRVARGFNALLMGGSPLTGAAIAYYLSNPFAAAIGVLGPSGIKAVLRSAIGGNVENAMQTLSRNGPQALGRTAVATQQAAQQAPLGPLNESLIGIPSGAPQ